MSRLNWDSSDYDRGEEFMPDKWKAPLEPLTVEQTPIGDWQAFREGIYGHGETREEAIESYYEEGGK